MAKPIKQPNGRWRIQWLDSHGKRKSETYTTFDAARSALKRHEVELDDIKAGRKRARSDQTLNEVYEEWLDSRSPAPDAAPDVQRRRSNRVRDNRRHLEHHVLPVLGGHRLPDIDEDVIKAFIKHLEGKRTARHNEKNDDDAGRTLSAATIANVIITLRKMMRDLKYPITVSYKVPKSGYGWIRKPADVARFLEACDPPWFRVACELAIYAGLRQGEAAGLRWDRVDFERGFIQIDRSYDGPTKSFHERVVPLSPELAERLKRWRLATGATSKGLVVTLDGEPIPASTSDFGKRARRVSRQAGIEPVTFHQLRHTYASYLAERASPFEVQRALGHAHIDTTMRYVHLDLKSSARAPRLHLTFSAPSGTVSAIASALDMHEDDSAPAAIDAI
jgi:integrase